ncbi:hypothetical protein HYU07_07170 [Candidatus Woesearchaeota archaeon]|nr:hypothetical protein [Candidatus Woesearchaeota archaeon]
MGNQYLLKTWELLIPGKNLIKGCEQENFSKRLGYHLLGTAECIIRGAIIGGAAALALRRSIDTVINAAIIGSTIDACQYIVKIKRVSEASYKDPEKYMQYKKLYLK